MSLQVNSQGSLFSFTLACQVCHTSYQYNFYVRASRRVYWDGIPDAIEVGEHQFVERRVIEGWLLDMLHSWYVYVFIMARFSLRICVRTEQEIRNKLCEDIQQSVPQG